MFFVVYSIEIRKYLIIPVNWVKDLSWEKHVNRSLNRNQFYRCFYSTKEEAWKDGVPDNNFIPNFLAPIGTTFPTEENCFVCRLAHYDGKQNPYYLNLLFYKTYGYGKF